LNKTSKGALLVVVLFLTLIVAPISANAQESIIIKGKLQNGTAGTALPAELAITLNVFKLGNSLETRESLTDNEGRFRFEEVPGGEGFGYIISTEYFGATYTYESDYPMLVETVDMIVYESTTSGEALKVRSHTLVVNAADPDNQLMNALELVGLENTGDRTFVPDITQAGQMDLLRFSLPTEVSDLDVQSSMRGGQILQVNLGFALTTPVPPGTYEIAYTFRSPYSSGKLTFDHALPFGADTFRVLLLDGLGEVTAYGLQEMGHLVLGERDYQHLEASDLEVGAKISLKFVDLPQPSLWQHWQDTVSGASFLTVVIPGTFGMALLALLAYVLIHKRNSSLITSICETAGLVEAIARLDDSFQQRNLGKQEYIQRRGELKGRFFNIQDRSSRAIDQTSHAKPISEDADPPSDSTAEETQRPKL
jgi:hypothetical protein